MGAHTPDSPAFRRPTPLPTPIIRRAACCGSTSRTTARLGTTSSASTSAARWRRTRARTRRPPFTRPPVPADPPTRPPADPPACVRPPTRPLCTRAHPPTCARAPACAAQIPCVAAGVAADVALYTASHRRVCVASVCPRVTLPVPPPRPVRRTVPGVRGQEVRGLPRRPRTQGAPRQGAIYSRDGHKSPLWGVPAPLPPTACVAGR